MVSLKKDDYCIEYVPSPTTNLNSADRTNCIIRDEYQARHCLGVSDNIGITYMRTSRLVMPSIIDWSVCDNFEKGLPWSYLLTGHLHRTSGE